jgi:hypothetical protein
MTNHARWRVFDRGNEMDVATGRAQRGARASFDSPEAGGMNERAQIDVGSDSAKTATRRRTYGPDSRRGSSAFMPVAVSHAVQLTALTRAQIV